MGKGSSKGHTPREAKDNLKSTQLLSVIDAISEGPVEGPVDGLKSVLLNSTPVLDSEGNTNISGVTVVFRQVSRSRHRRRDLNPPAPRRCWVRK
ncbi:putative phage tail component [Escherichia coli]|nr:putative phage tail component [Escherichia coli]